MPVPAPGEVGPPLIPVPANVRLGAARTADDCPDRGETGRWEQAATRVRDHHKPNVWLITMPREVVVHGGGLPEQTIIMLPDLPTKVPCQV